MNIKRLGIDLAKNVFQIHGVDSHEQVAVRKQLKRNQMHNWFKALPPCLIGIEACAGSHYWARQLMAYGHTVRLIAPQFVKPYVKSNKNDANDAEAICEAVSRPSMRFVTIKTVEQQVTQAEHRIRSRLVRERTALSNETRSLLGEFGIVMPIGLATLRRALPALLSDGAHELNGRFIELLHALYDELCALDTRIETLNKRLNQRAHEDERVQRLMAIEGMGPISASALIAAVGDGRQFANGREMAAWLGLVPRQHSSGGKERLGGISKRGDPYVRTLLIHGARAAVNASVNKEDVRSRWVQTLTQRRNRNIATVALANKNARIAWAILSRGEHYRNVNTQTA